MLEGLPVIHPRKLSGRERKAQRAQLIELFERQLQPHLNRLSSHLPPCQTTDSGVHGRATQNFEHELTVLVQTTFYSVLPFPDWQEWLEAQRPVLPTHEQARIEVKTGSDPWMVLDYQHIDSTELALFWRVESSGTAWPKLPNTTRVVVTTTLPIFEPEAFTERYAQLMT
jgi:hypothetical protein